MRYSPAHLCFILVMFYTTSGYAQKGTDHDKFARKFYQFYSYSEDKIESLLPDKEAMLFINSKTGEPADKIEARIIDYKKQLKKEVNALSMKGQNKGNVIDGSRIEVLQETPIKTANIFLSTHWGSEKFTFLLHNCIRTDKGWYLGDFVGFEGESKGNLDQANFSATRSQINQWLSNTSKEYDNLTDAQWNCVQIFGEYKEIPFYSEKLKNKLPDSSTIEMPQFMLLKSGQLQGKLIPRYGKGERSFGNAWKRDGDKLMINGETSQTFDIYHVSSSKLILKDGRNFYYDFVNHVAYVKEANQKASASNSSAGNSGVKPWIAPSFPVQNAEPYTEFFKKELMGKPVRGYYIDRRGNKVNSVIKYQEPEVLCNTGSTLLLYNVAYDEAGFTEDESNNFKQALLKDSVIAFFVGDQVFVPVQLSSKVWGVLRSEGAIRQVALFGKVNTNNKSGYLVSTILDKLNGKKENVTSMALTFRNSMADLVIDNLEMAEKIRSKADGYKLMQLDKVISEYNTWFDKQYPNMVKYLFNSDGSIAWKP